jgi:hypothetical protein
MLVEPHSVVIYPLMPKGVEHIKAMLTTFLDTLCDLSVDAERR